MNNLLKKISLNRITIWLVIIGYLVVNIGMQIKFFANQNIFDKYQVATDAVDALSIAQHAYYAKTAFLLILLVLLASRVPFGLGFGLSFLSYAVLMFIFFGLGTATMLYLVAAIALLASYFISRKSPPTSTSPV